MALKTSNKKKKHKPIIDLDSYIRDVRTMYKEDESQRTFNSLLLGEVGSGKSHMLKTARAPVLVHSFDPGGTKHLRKEEEAGKMVLDTRFEADRMDSPEAYKLWETEFERLFEIDAFNRFGTYAIDSFTMWMMSLKYKILKEQGRKDGVMAMHDWQILGNVVTDMVKVTNALPCDVIFTGHLSLEKDDVTGRQKAMIETIPSLQTTIPQLFDEIYVLESVETSKGIERSIITANTGKYQARTRIGSEIFETRETADFKYLLKKAGFDPSDKPLFKTEEE